jgi:hypothetical protein
MITNIDTLIKEWFYALPKGYATPPYTDEELYVLRDIMLEHNIDLSEQSNVVAVINESSQDIRDINDLIKDLSDDEIEDVRKYIVSIGFRKTLTPYLYSKGMSPSSYQLGAKGTSIIFDRISSLPNIREVLEYFDDPPKLTYNTATGVGNLVDATKLPKDVIFELMQIQPGPDLGGNATGPAEVAFALLFSDVTNKVGGGDLEYQGRTLEVKGKSARLGTQSRIKSTIDSSFVSYLLDKAVALGFITEDDYVSFVNDTDHRNISIAIRDMYMMLIDAGYERPDLVQQIQKGISNIYFNELSVVEQYINSSTDFSDVNVIAKQICKINIEAYMNKISVDMILFHNFRPSSADYNFAIISIDDVDKVVEAGTISLGSKKREGSFFWHDTNPGVVLSI